MDPNQNPYYQNPYYYRYQQQQQQQNHQQQQQQQQQNHQQQQPPNLNPYHYQYQQNHQQQQHQHQHQHQHDVPPPPPLPPPPLPMDVDLMESERTDFNNNNNHEGYDAAVTNNGDNSNSNEGHLHNTSATTATFQNTMAAAGVSGTNHGREGRIPPLPVPVPVPVPPVQPNHSMGLYYGSGEEGMNVNNNNNNKIHQNTINNKAAMVDINKHIKDDNDNNDAIMVDSNHDMTERDTLHVNNGTPSAAAKTVIDLSNDNVDEADGNRNTTTTTSTTNSIENPSSSYNRNTSTAVPTAGLVIPVTSSKKFVEPTMVNQQQQQQQQRLLNDDSSHQHQHHPKDMKNETSDHHHHHHPDTTTSIATTTTTTTMNNQSDRTTTTKNLSLPPPPPPRDNNKNDDDTTNENDDEIHILTPQEVERERRRKRRRTLYHLLKKPGVIPSFLAVVTQQKSEVKKEEGTTLEEIDNDDGLLAPPIVVIDVDEYLGLKQKTNISIVSPDGMVSSSSSSIMASSSFSSSRPDGPLSSASSMSGAHAASLWSNQIPPTVPSSSSSSSALSTIAINPHHRPPPQMTMTPAEEGWYEGRVPLKMIEDSYYLNDLQQLVRDNLEFFSATIHDATMSQSGRRHPTVRGKVGIRCIHCARVVLSKLNSTTTTATTTPGTKSPWPPGSVSYPVSISGMYSVCSQKPQLHFETCPNFPMSTKARLHEVLSASRSNQTSSDFSTTTSTTSPNKRNQDGSSSSSSGLSVHTRMTGGMGALMYYAVAAKRIGLVEVGSGSGGGGSVGKGSSSSGGSIGLRFSRDLSLEPLPFATTRSQVERDHPELLPKRFQTAASSSSGGGAGIKPTRVGSSSSSTSNKGTAATIAASAAARATIRADPDSERILTEALAESDDPAHSLVRKVDQQLVTDYMFLAIRQMCLCHATSMDFLTRGKKTKSMRLGFAGFCCRHCGGGGTTAAAAAAAASTGGSGGGGSGPSNGGAEPDYYGQQQGGGHVDYSCRSFSSAPDNLASAISNSFVIHLQKCHKVPVPLKRALTAYKRIHPRQMQTLVYGSQRRLFHELWERLRAADLPEPPANSITAAPAVAPAAQPKQPQSAGSSKADKEEEEWNQEDDEMYDDDDDDDEEPEVTKITPSRRSRGDSEGVATSKPDPVASSMAPTPPAAVATTSDVILVDPSRDNARNPNFPVSGDPATQALLKKYEADWNLADNDNLITPEDRNLVSDYVFLTMRQLKVAIPRQADFRGNRRNNVVARMAGMCCIYCNPQKELDGGPGSDEIGGVGGPDQSLQQGFPSGRSFPSAPDNMASALNSSLYNHMQNCFHVPMELKHAFANLRKIHSSQCASLKFGSQRRYFNRVYQKLMQIPIGNHPATYSPAPNNSSASLAKAKANRSAPTAGRTMPPPSKISVTTTVAELDPSVLSKYSFALGAGYAQCLRCRMVPFELRASGSLCFDNQTLSSLAMQTCLERHSRECRSDELHLELAAKALGRAVAAMVATDVKDHNSDSQATLISFTTKFQESPAYPRFISTVVGRHGGLIDLFSKEIFQEPGFKAAIGIAGATSSTAISVSGSETEDHHKAETSSTTKRGLWKELLSLTVDFAQIQVDFEIFAKELELPTSQQLQDHPKLIRFLQIISPCLQCPSLPPLPSPSVPANPPTPLVVVGGAVSSSDESLTQKWSAEDHQEQPPAQGGEQEKRLTSTVQASSQKMATTDKPSLQNNGQVAVSSDGSVKVTEDGGSSFVATIKAPQEEENRNDGKDRMLHQEHEGLKQSPSQDMVTHKPFPFANSHVTTLSNLDEVTLVGNQERTANSSKAAPDSNHGQNVVPRQHESMNKSYLLPAATSDRNAAIFSEKDKSLSLLRATTSTNPNASIIPAQRTVGFPQKDESSSPLLPAATTRSTDTNSAIIPAAQRTMDFLQKDESSSPLLAAVTSGDPIAAIIPAAQTTMRFSQKDDESSSLSLLHTATKSDQNTATIPAAQTTTVFSQQQKDASSAATRVSSDPK